MLFRNQCSDFPDGMILEEEVTTANPLSKKAHLRNCDVQIRDFNFTAFIPPLECTGSKCENVMCPSRRDDNVGNSCIYTKPRTNQEIQQGEK